MCCFFFFLAQIFLNPLVQTQFYLKNSTKIRKSGLSTLGQKFRSNPLELEFINVWVFQSSRRGSLSSFPNSTQPYPFLPVEFKWEAIQLHYNQLLLDPLHTHTHTDTWTDRQTHTHSYPSISMQLKI